MITQLQIILGVIIVGLCHKCSPARLEGRYQRQRLRRINANARSHGPARNTSFQMIVGLVAARRRALGLDLTPDTHIGVMLIERHRKGMPARAIRHKEDEIGALRV